MIVTAAFVEGALGSQTLSDPGGITQFGLHLQVLAPRASTGVRHWHSAEDEMLYVLDGEATLQDDAGETVLYPGDAACFRHGDPNAHAMVNRSAAPCRWLMLGSRALGDICTYADGRRQVNSATDWHIEAPTGERLKGGALPDHLLNLAPPWGAPGTGPHVIRAAPPQHQAEQAHPVLGGGLGAYEVQLISDRGGLTQFGAFIETLPPGSLSSFRHWHAAEDEMAYVLSGHPTLIEDTETLLSPGTAVAWAKGKGPGHCLANRSDAPASYLVIGTRLPRDTIHYPDHGLITHKDGPARRYEKTS